MAGPTDTQRAVADFMDCLLTASSGQGSHHSGGQTPALGGRGAQLLDSPPLNLVRGPAQKQLTSGSGFPSGGPTQHGDATPRSPLTSA